MIEGIGTSSMDRTSMARDFFKKMDSNSDGSLDSSELTAMAKDGKGPSAEKILQKWDADGDGTINESENQTAMESMQAPPGGMSDMFSELLKKISGSQDDSESESDSDGSKLAELLYQEMQRHQQMSTTYSSSGGKESSDKQVLDLIA